MKAPARNVWLSLPWQAFAAFVVVLPSTAVVVTRATQGNLEPAGADAAATTTGTASIASDKHDLAPLPTASADDLAMLAKLAEIKKLGFGEESPLKLVMSLRRGAQVPTTPGSRTGDIGINIEFPDDVHLTTIFVTKEMTTAVIDNTTVRVGDLIAEVWQVVEIDPVEQVVVMRHPAGIDHRLTLRKEEPKEPEPKRNTRPTRLGRPR